MKFDTKRILEEVKRRGFYETWTKYSNLVPKEGRFAKVGDGKPHPVQELVWRVRRVLLDLGFEEVILPIMVDVSEVYRQYGPEAPVILDRIYFLAGLPRPDIGLDMEKERIIAKELGIDGIDKLRSLFREYRKGGIDADELIEVLKARLAIDDQEALKLLTMFEPFFNLKPEPSSLTLRSHMTASWFSAISEILEYREPPLYLFSIDWVFRREQREDEGHLRNYRSASLVVVDEGLGEEGAKTLIDEVMRRLGFENIKTVTRADTARYYALGREWEVYADFMGKIYEVATGGFYNPISLAKYGIPYPVFNLGIGVERLAQILVSEKDIRKLLYRHRHFEPSDEEIASMLKPIDAPETEKGRKISSIIAEEVERAKNELGMFKKRIYEDDEVEIYLYEPDEGKRFAGPAAFNRIYVRDGNILSTLNEAEGIFIARYVDLLALRFARMIEEGRSGQIKVRWVDGPSDVNLYIPEKLLKWMQERGKSVDVSGPVFLDIIVRRKG